MTPGQPPPAVVDFAGVREWKVGDEDGEDSGDAAGVGTDGDEPFIVNAEKQRRTKMQMITQR